MRIAVHYKVIYDSMRLFKRYILVLLIGMLSHSLSAQYVGEVGVMGGVSYYMAMQILLHLSSRTTLMAVSSSV